MARPIVSTSSRRRTNQHSARQIWVLAQTPHLERRGRSRSSRPFRRSVRHRPCPHGLRTPRHGGHTNNPASRSRSTAASSVPTMSIGCLRHLRTVPSRRTPNLVIRRALTRTGRAHSRRRDPTKTNPTRTSTMLFDSDATTPGDAQSERRSTPGSAGRRIPEFDVRIFVDEDFDAVHAVPHTPAR